MMQIRDTIPMPHAARPRPFGEDPTAAEPNGPPPRIARLIALAHKLEELVRTGAVESYGELARLGFISPARLSQILILAQLAPAIQEYVLFMPAKEAGSVEELDLREIAREPCWGQQCSVFKAGLSHEL